MPITTTLNRIYVCTWPDKWRELLAGLGKTEGDDEPLAYTKIVEINGIYEALWACNAEPQYAKEWRLFSIWCARQVEHLMTDQRSKDAIIIAERYANGQATDEELSVAMAMANPAAVKASLMAAPTAYYAAYTAWYMMQGMPHTTDNVSVVAYTAAQAAWHALGDTAWNDARDAQKEHFIEICNATEARESCNGDSK
jgi:hypothetical protein